MAALPDRCESAHRAASPLQTHAINSVRTRSRFQSVACAISAIGAPKPDDLTPSDTDQGHATDQAGWGRRPLLGVRVHLYPPAVEGLHLHAVVRLGRGNRPLVAARRCRRRLGAAAGLCLLGAQVHLRIALAQRFDSLQEFGTADVLRRPNRTRRGRRTDRRAVRGRLTGPVRRLPARGEGELPPRHGLTTDDTTLEHRLRLERVRHDPPDGESLMGQNDRRPGGSSGEFGRNQLSLRERVVLSARRRDCAASLRSAQVRRRRRRRSMAKREAIGGGRARPSLASPERVSRRYGVTDTCSGA